MTSQAGVEMRLRGGTQSVGDQGTGNDGHSTRVVGNDTCNDGHCTRDGGQTSGHCIPNETCRKGSSVPQQPGAGSPLQSPSEVRVSRHVHSPKLEMSERLSRSPMSPPRESLSGNSSPPKSTPPLTPTPTASVRSAFAFFNNNEKSPGNTDNKDVLPPREGLKQSRGATRGRQSTSKPVPKPRPVHLSLKSQLPHNAFSCPPVTSCFAVFSSSSLSSPDNSSFSSSSRLENACVAGKTSPASVTSSSGSSYDGYCEGPMRSYFSYSFSRDKENDRNAINSPTEEAVGTIAVKWCDGATSSPRHRMAAGCIGRDVSSLNEMMETDGSDDEQSAMQCDGTDDAVC